MDIYKGENIRNVAVLGHGGCGKTLLVEAAALSTGIISRLGKIEDGSTISDYDKEEAKRQFSISTSLVPIICENTKINFLDTPGYFDFVGEVEEALDVVDAAIIVVSAKAGVEVGTIKAWEMCEKRGLPRFIYLSSMDDQNANFEKVLEDLESQFGKKIAPFHTPFFEDEKFVGYVNLVKMAGRKYMGNNKTVDCPIPDSVKDEAETNRITLIEAVAETSEDLMEKYFGGEEFTQEEISDALHLSVASGDTVPVFVGSNIYTTGVPMLLEAIVKYFPSPVKNKISGKNVKTNADFAADYDDTKSFSAKVFKTLVDPFIGKFSFVKICSGVLKSDSAIFNADKDTEEKLSRLYILRGKEQIEVKELHAGDIGAIGKLSNTATGDTLSTKAEPIEFARAEYSKPYAYLRFKTKNKGDDDKVSQALGKLMEEDKTLKLVIDKENRQTLLYGIGEQQIDVCVSKLLQRYKVEVETMQPRIAYREAIRKPVKKQGKYKKQSGGHGQYGDVTIEFEPSGDMEKPYIFEEKIVGGVVPKNYFPAVEKGIAESVVKGPLAGYPVVGIKATLVFGSYHPVDSSEMAFKTAASMAFKDAFQEASPMLLEPIANMKVLVPDKFTGDIMGDLNKRRGKVMGMNPVAGGKQEILAEIPIAETFGYSTDLRSMTGGIGEYSYEFDRYEMAPSEVMQKAIDEAKKLAEEEE